MEIGIERSMNKYVNREAVQSPIIPEIAKMEEMVVVVSQRRDMLFPAKAAVPSLTGCGA